MGAENLTYFEGSLDDLRLYARPLSKLEIDLIYMAYLEQVASQSTVLQTPKIKKEDSLLIPTGQASLYPGQLTSSTLYEDAEDTTTNGWLIYNEGTVENVIGGANDSERSIKIKGNLASDVFRLGKEDGSSWDNKREFYAEFSLLFEEQNSGAIYFQLNTSAGIKYLVYGDSGSSGVSDPDILRIDLGEIADGKWHTIFRSFQEDFEAHYPEIQIKSVKDLFIYGSLSIDEIKLLDFDAGKSLGGLQL